MTKPAASTATTDPWSDDSPAIACEREFRVVGDGEQYLFRLLGVPIEFEFDRPRFDRGDLIGLLTVRTALAGARTYAGVLNAGTMNLSSTTARNTRAKQLLDLSRAPQIDWLRLMEELSIRTLTAVRDGATALDLRTITRAAAVDSLDVDGIRILERHPIFWFGDGGAGKSLLALYIGGELARRGLKVLYADWELEGEDHRDRFESLFGAAMPALFYARCSRPMTAEADRLRRLVRQHDIDYLICDSVAFACDGRPEDAEVAARYFQCLRQIGVGSLNVAHTNKSDESDKKPFGSAFWHNGARATWNVKLSETTDTPGEITVGCYNRKANLSTRQPAVGFRIEFGARTRIGRVDLAHVDDLAAGLSLRQRIRSAVTRQPQTLASLAEQLSANVESLNRTVRKHRDTFSRVTGSDGVARIALVERGTS